MENNNYEKPRFVFPLIIVTLSTCNIGKNGVPTQTPSVNEPVSVSTVTSAPENLVLGKDINASTSGMFDK